MTPDEEGARRLVEEAFGRTQRPPSPGFADRVLARVRAERRPGAGTTGWSLALVTAGLAITLVGLVAAGGSLLHIPATRIAGQGTAPTAQPLGTGGPAGAEVPATFLVPAGAGPAPFLRVDWDGRTVATFSPPTSARLVASPDGQLAALPDANGPGAAILDTEGRVVSHVAAFGAWSSEGAHVACALDGGAVIVTDLTASARPRQASHPMQDASPPGPGSTLPGCATEADRVVATRMVGGTLAEVALIQLGTGRVVWRRTYATWTLLTDPVVSHDGRYLAENDRASRHAAIRDLTTGDVVARTDGLVAAFSGDDRLVLLNAGDAAHPRAAIADWRRGGTIWNETGRVTALAARPHGADFVVSLAALGQGPRRLLVRPGRDAVELRP